MDHVDRRVAEHRHPHQGEPGRHQQHAADEFTDGPPPGNARDEHAHEGRPGDPPAPVEECPAADPVGRVVGIEVEGLVDDLRQVGAGVFHVGLEQEDRWPKHQDDQHQQHGQQQIGLGEDADPPVQAADQRQRGQAHGNQDQDDLHADADR
ncbi:hypothetical protein D3C77_490970 [compost metagenome]